MRGQDRRLKENESFLCVDSATFTKMTGQSLFFEDIKENQTSLFIPVIEEVIKQSMSHLSPKVVVSMVCAACV